MTENELRLRLSELCVIRSANHVQRAKEAKATALTSEDYLRGLYTGRAETYALIADLLSQPDYEKVLAAAIRQAKEASPK